MKNQIICSFQKDIMEYIRTKKTLLFSSTLFFLCAVVFLATKTFPTLISALISSTSHIASNSDTITSSLIAFFPENLKDNMGILSSDIIIFYGIVVILSTYNLIKKEIDSGKWIFPSSVGYKPFVLIISKGVVYGLGAAVPSVIFYNLYYVIGNVYLFPDYYITSALVNSLILGFAIFSIVYITITLSTICKQAIMSVVTIIPFIVIAPDVFSLFAFGKYLPTHILTYLYQSMNNYNELLAPMVMTFSIALFLSVLASKKALDIEVSR